MVWFRKCPTLICLAIGLAATLIDAQRVSIAWAEDGTNPPASVGVASARVLSNAFRDAAEKMLPSVVTVLGQVENKEQPIMNIIGGSESQKYASVGSGVIISADGLILTNHHVIADTSRVDVRLYDGHIYEAHEIKSDPASDLAILRIKSDEPFPAATLGASDELHVGDWVLAIGSPFQLEASVSAGIISRTERYQKLSQDVQGRFLQTDAAINPGNSGGPLLDLEGNVIGINTAITSRNGGFQGVGFAIPITRAKWIRRELEEHGKVRRAQMGVRAFPLPPDVSEELKLARGMGVQVESVVYNRAGQKAGLKPRDVILRIGSEQVTAANFREVVQQSPIGEAVKMIIIRDGSQTELTIELEALQ